jgi:hypothetical protein
VPRPARTVPDHTESAIGVRVVPGAGAPPRHDLLVDGSMRGSELVLEADLRGAPARPPAPSRVGSSGGFGIPAWLDDGCAPRSCSPRLLLQRDSASAVLVQRLRGA